MCECIFLFYSVQEHKTDSRRLQKDSFSFSFFTSTLSSRHKYLKNYIREIFIILCHRFSKTNQKNRELKMIKKSVLIIIILT